MISRKEEIPMEHIEMKCSLYSELQIGYICSSIICSRNRDIVEKPLQLTWNLLCTPKTRSQITPKLKLLLSFRVFPHNHWNRHFLILYHSNLAWLRINWWLNLSVAKLVVSKSVMYCSTIINMRNQGFLSFSWLF